MEGPDLEFLEQACNIKIQILLQVEEYQTLMMFLMLKQKMHLR